MKRKRSLRVRPIVSMVFVTGVIASLFLHGAVRPLLSAESAVSQTEKPLDALEMAAWIDRQLDASWANQRLVPAPKTTDSEFVRRIFLDLIGRIPSVGEVREFLTDSRLDKRQILVEELLQRGAFSAHLANTWRELLLAGSTAAEARVRAPALETWLKLRFTANMPYDQLATELLTASLEQRDLRLPSPQAFYQAAEFKPETLAANVSKVFLGVQVQCAQCHDHPFAAWKQTQFWSFAALFNNLDPQREAAMMQDSSGSTDEIKIPGKEIVVPALFLDGTKPDRSNNANHRLMLARWVTGAENPLFAKAVVNRVWGNFFGRGFVQPIDDLDPANAPIHGEVFDELCRQFRLHKCDLKYLMRVITATRAYQLSCRGPEVSGEDLSLHFARMPLRRMTSDQVYASFVQATGYREPGTPNRQNVLIANGARDEFQSKFADSAVAPTDIETTILQALLLMNGRLVADATNVEQSEFLTAVADAPFFDESSRITALFMATLSRAPRSDEIELFASTSPSGDPAGQRAALADLFWSLLNSAEFLLNH